VDLSARTLRAAERIVLVDSRGRQYLVDLVEGGSFHSHTGVVAHGDLIGRPEGTTVRSTTGARYTAMRPTLAEYVLRMPRGAQVVYPKDLGPIVMYADVYPGASVIEAGTGSGALTIALCRAVGSQGRVVSFEARDEHHVRARDNIEAFFGKVPDQLVLRSGDVAEVGIEDGRFDRCVLDVPEPWVPLPALRAVLEPGAVLCTYLPTTIQLQQLVVALPDEGFLHIESFETLRRTWHVGDRSVRPDHRMVGHTGFVSIARRLA
jgi:tRNA (adenine57-N1/adenine58-N1)-methyltransferase